MFVGRVYPGGGVDEVPIREGRELVAAYWGHLQQYFAERETRFLWEDGTGRPFKYIKLNLLNYQFSTNWSF